MSLSTGERISRKQYTKLPITQRVIEAVEGLAAAQGQPLLPGAGPVFEWNVNEPINEEEEDEPIFEPQQEHDDIMIVDGDHGPVWPVLAAGEADNGPPELDPDDYGAAPHQEEEGEAPGGAVYIPNEDIDEGDEPDDDAPGNYDTEGEDETDTADDNDRDDGEEEDDVLPPPSPMYNLRPNRVRDYSHRFDQQTDNPHHQLLQASIHADWKDVFGFVMHQMTATAGIKKHGQTAVHALFKEFAQLDDRDTFEPVLASELTREAKRDALRAVSNLIKEKRTGELKGRTCADGRPQRSLYSKDETTSPTISQEALCWTNWNQTNWTKGIQKLQLEAI
jgi:hypothetical protein